MEFLIFIAFIFAVIILLPLTIVKITSWEKIVGHWYSLLTERLGKNVKATVFEGFSGTALFYCVYLFFTSEGKIPELEIAGRNVPLTERFFYGSFIAFGLIGLGFGYWRVLRTIKEAQLLTLATVALLGILMFLLLSESPQKTLIHFAAVAISGYWGWRMLVIKLRREMESKNA